MLFLFLAVSNTTTAQSNTQSVAARYPGLAAYSREYSDLYATRNNVAALAQLKNNSVGIYAENRFLIPELNLFTASIGIKANNGAFALHGSYYGLDVYHQTSLSLGYGMSVAKNVDVGVQFNYLALQQANGYGSASAINASVGAIFHLTDKVHAGINIYNPTSSGFGKGGVEKIPAQFTFGMGYDASDKVYVSAEMVKEENFPNSINAGFQYRFQKQFLCGLVLQRLQVMFMLVLDLCLNITELTLRLVIIHNLVFRQEFYCYLTLERKVRNKKAKSNNSIEDKLSMK